MVALAAAVVAPRAVHAQWTPIPLDRPMTFTVTEDRIVDDRTEWNEGMSFDGTVRPGMTLSIRLVWLTNPPTRNIGVTISDPGSFGSSEPTMNTTMPDGSVVATKTFNSSGGIALIVSGKGAPAGHRYSITITEGAPAVSTSGPFTGGATPAAPYKTTGIELSAGFGPVTFASDIATERGTGAAGRIAYNFGALAIFGEGQLADMAPDDGTAEDEYQMLHAEGGARLYLLPSRMRLRPYAQAGYGVRRLTASNDVQAEGMGPAFGAGAHFFLSENLSLEGAWRQSSGDIDRVRPTSSDEWQDIPPEFVITGKSTRILGMLSVHF